MRNSKIWDQLEGRFKLPDNWQTSLMTGANGRNLFCAKSLPETGINGHVLAVEGLGEYGQKYAELARDFNKQAWGFHIFDRAGQGLSGRNTPHPYKIHCDDYRDDVKDIIHYAMTKIPHDGKPIVMLAHSTGGLLALPALYHDSQKPEQDRLFKKAVITDPLWGFLEPAARNRDQIFARVPMPRIMREAGVPGGLKEWVARNHAQSLHKADEFSTDPVRSLVHDFWQTHKPQLRVASATLGWLQEMSRAMTLIRRPGYVEDIEHPLTICTSDMKLHVDPLRITQTMARMQNVRHLDFPDGKHELLMERDHIRNRIIAEVIRLG